MIDDPKKQNLEPEDILAADAQSAPEAKDAAPVMDWGRADEIEGTRGMPRS